MQVPTVSREACIVKILRELKNLAVEGVAIPLLQF